MVLYWTDCVYKGKAVVVHIGFALSKDWTKISKNINFDKANLKSLHN